MSTLASLQEIIHKKYGLEASALDPAASIKDLGLDSLAVAEFLFEVEDQFHISVPEDQLTDDTLNGLAKLVDELLRAKEAAAAATATDTSASQ